MTVSHHIGPLIVTGDDNTAPGSNPSPGPSLFRHGVGILDPRFNLGAGGGENTPVFGWFGVTRIPVINAVPVAMAANNIAAAQVPVANTPLNLVAVSGAGIVAGVKVGATPVVAIENAATPIMLGAYPTISLYDPADAIARNVRITQVGNEATATFTIKGFDFYGLPLTETLAGTAPGIVVGKKAFKFIQSVTPAGVLSGSNVSVGTGDTFGFPLRVDNFGNVEIYAAQTLITATAGFTAAVTTDPSTPLLGDTRGTYAVQTPSDGVRRLNVFITPDPANLTTAGLFGVANV